MSKHKLSIDRVWIFEIHHTRGDLAQHCERVNKGCRFYNNNKTIHSIHALYYVCTQSIILSPIELVGKWSIHTTQETLYIAYYAA